MFNDPDALYNFNYFDFYFPESLKLMSWAEDLNFLNNIYVISRIQYLEIVD
jgi:hypothetical protein